MVILFFWPLPVLLFIILIGIVLCGAAYVYLVFPGRAVQGAKFLCNFYSAVTVLYVIYSSLAGERSEEGHADWVFRAFIELGVVILVFIGIYYVMKNRLQKGSV